jgi:hypothetical protein
MIKVSLGDATGDKPNIVQDAVALVDTGSDFCRIDDDIVGANRFTQVGEITSKHENVTFTRKTYIVQIIIDGHCLPLICAGFPIHSSGSVFDVLLGMDAIRLFDLSVNRSQHRVSLTWTGL